MIEVLVAILIVGIASLATFTLLADAVRNVQRAKAGQVALEYAEQELEYLRSLENKKLALTTAPARSTKPGSPNYRVGENTFALNRNPVGNYRNLVINGGSLYGGGEIEGGAIEPGPTKFTSGNVTGRIYRYIVWHNDENCAEATCPGKQDYKQIIVVAKLSKLSNQPGETGYFEVQSNFIDPTKNAEKDPLPGSGGAVVTAQQFFLSDTPCSSTGTTNRIEITGNHPLHNTLGECSQGAHTGSTAGAPDALLLGSPPTSESETAVPAYQYSNDLYTETGLQLVKEETSGCSNNPTGATNPASQIHRWLTDQMAEEFKMTGRVTVEFFTRTLNEATYNSGICMYLFDRHPTSTGYTDTYLTNLSGGTAYWLYNPPSAWPKVWTSVRRTLELSAAKTIPKGDRLGFAMSTERVATSAAKAISIMYDHPTYASRIEVDTSTPINGG